MKVTTRGPAAPSNLTRETCFGASMLPCFLISALPLVYPSTLMLARSLYLNLFLSSALPLSITP